eukprot:TCALIF_01168-PA protein Name:"Similar to Rac1 Ras-related C3 botulinum toxin substrate 1 (Rattus norvegicus)" AED:0.24 eAED:0.24 QI:0/0.33/0/0.75/1/1/4/0/190
MGDGSVGKTSLLLSYTTNTFPGLYVPTVFDNYAANLMVDGNYVHLGLWDTAGQSDYDRLRPLAYPETDVFIVCFSLTEKDSVDNVRCKWIPELRHHRGEDVPVLLVGTKMDLRTKDNAKSCMSTLHGHALAQEVGADKFIECSALSQENVTQVFEEVARLVIYPRKKKSSGKKCRCDSESSDDEPLKKPK